jgi:hypothetical protein
MNKQDVFLVHEEDKKQGEKRDKADVVDSNRGQKRRVGR